MENQPGKLKEIKELKNIKLVEISNSEKKMLDSSGTQEKAEKINEAREKVVNLFNTENSVVLSENKKELAVSKLQDLNNQNSISENIKYHKDLEFKAKERIHYFKNQIGSVGFALFGYPTFFEIAKYLGEHGANGQELLLEKIKSGSFLNERLASILEVKSIILEDGHPGYVVKIDKSKWTGAIWGPGVAFPEMKIAFVAEGLSERSTKLIEDHEIYHLNNPKASESKTIINTNLKKDFLGSAILVIQSCINIPRWSVNVVKEIIKETS